MKIVDIQWKRPRLLAGGNWDVYAPGATCHAWPCWWEVFTDSMPGMVLSVNAPNAVISKPQCRAIRGNDDSTQIMSYGLAFLENIPGAELDMPDGGYNIRADLWFQVGHAGEWELHSSGVGFHRISAITWSPKAGAVIDKVQELIPLLRGFCSRAENYWQYRSSTLLTKADPLKWQADQLVAGAQKFSQKLIDLGSPACD